MKLTGEAADGEQAVALASERPRPDVMLMDLRMPVMDGVTATRHIISQADACNSDKPRIIALTTFNWDQAVVDAAQAGASGYLLKSAEPEFLLAASYGPSTLDTLSPPQDQYTPFSSTPRGRRRQRGGI
ncbi:response regulator transcription factor [Arthrobacter sp. ISL-30]|uniref:response regulator n=1 Tax=Arthrobacter sp. ISL-30 TaxID=2819109 RepID=UPI0020358CCA|nr:response regulator transcription factor [Arthrobacter sp. ISL-30]